MRYHMFLYTRDKNRDYGWRMKAEYLPDDTYERYANMTKLIREYQNWPDEIWRKLLFFVRFGEVGMILRVIPAMETDNFGREIFSFEGLSFHGVTPRRILDIPNVIQFLYKDDSSFREKYYSGLREADVDIQPGMNPLEDWETFVVTPEELNHAMFRKLVFDVSDFRVGYSLIFGAKARAAEYMGKKIGGLEATYDLEAEKEDVSVMPERPLTYCELAPASNERHSGELCISFIKTKRGYGYSWQINDIRTQNPEIRSGIQEFRSQIHFGKLFGEEKKIKTYMMRIGWSFPMYK